MKNDCAVAPVVAGLLILAVIVTVISVYFTTYVPSLKEEAEIEHLSNVEREFLLFSSDIENAVWQKSEGRLSRNIELGGGDVFLSSIKSGGVLQVFNDSVLYQIKNSSGISKNFSAVRFSYTPISNFWHNQGYSWQFGYVNLTTEYGEQTPLLYSDMNSVKLKLNTSSNSSGLFSSLFDINCMYEPVFEKDAYGNFTGTNYLNCTEISMTLTGFKTGEKNYASGNGLSALSLETQINNYDFTEEKINFTVFEETPLNINETLWKDMNKKLALIEKRKFNNVHVLCYQEDIDEHIGDSLGISFIDPLKVKIREINLIISAQ